MLNFSLKIKGSVKVKLLKIKILRISILIFWMLFTGGLFSQNIARNNFFAEAPGVTGIYSVNYERLLFNSDNVNLGLRLGFANTFNSQYYNPGMLIPLSFSLIKNLAKSHFLELRVSLTNNLYIYKDWSGQPLGDSSHSFVPQKKLGIGLVPGIGIGYRYQPETKGLFFNFLLQRIAYFSKENWYEKLSLGVGFAF